MTAIPENIIKMSVEEYFAFDEQSEVRHEFFDGEIFEVSATTLNHNEIVDNAKQAVKKVFKPRGCKAFSESVKLEAVKGKYYPYPDVMLTCAESDMDGKRQFISKPILLVEVLSDSTAGNDRGFKWNHYKKIPSLQYYMMISQNKVEVELFSRLDGIRIWRYGFYDSMDDIIQFEKLDFSLSLKEIYEGIVF